VQLRVLQGGDKMGERSDPHSPLGADFS
jgi:hypothetical protein